MEIELPSQGCNVVYNNYIDNYRNNVRSRYYIVNQQLVLNSTQNYNTIPSGYNCYTGSLEYKPELKIYLPFLSLGLCFMALILVYKVIIKRIMP